jgi:hypothetical protein
MPRTRKTSTKPPVPPRIGRPPINPKDPLQHVGFRLPESLIGKLDAKAQELGLSQSVYLRQVIEAALLRV